MTVAAALLGDLGSILWPNLQGDQPERIRPNAKRQSRNVAAVIVSKPSGSAVRMRVAMRERVSGLASEWRRRGFDRGLRIIAVSYVTLGKIGFEGRVDCGAVGSVVRLAARLCAVAETSQK